MVSRASNRFATAALSLLSFVSVATAQPAGAEVVCDDHPGIVQNVPTYRWQDTSQQAKGVAIAIHGLTMHGGVFDTMARNLSQQGFVVLAPDLRGYGRWLQDSKLRDNVKDPDSVDYDGSYEDLVALLQATRDKYPGLPVFCVGESLGANLALRAAGEHPDCIDGLILSSPAVKHHYFVGPLFEQTGAILVSPRRQIDLIRYIKKFASNDPQVIEGALSDPLVRKRLSMAELFRTSAAMRPVLDDAKKIPESMPVLVIQGSADKMVRSRAMINLISQLKSTDQTVRWFSNRGHLLLETSYVRPDTMETVEGWLAYHMHKLELAKGNHDQLTHKQSVSRLLPVHSPAQQSAQTLASQPESN